ncbi:hypothetical protein [Haloferula rosea]|uniref:Uncharacterized protein n=1 Tax=Haloferula rosea TaxID=490093 RepID=A0A934RBR5_9BACT|nr:hypothetical protein [Haloferula rosea]MBK1826076.1 hypothetical protein [Haloferula rosea]
MPVQPTPPQLFDEFESGNITRAQLHAGLQWHARELVEEIIEVHENPIAAWWDTMLAKRTADRWASRHGIWRIRHVLAALARVPGFEPARFLWQALHADVPLHCFFRLRQKPVFRLTKLENRRGMLRAEVEYEDADEQIVRSTFLLEHTPEGLSAELVPQ